jgi:hypothetical protein
MRYAADVGEREPQSENNPGLCATCQHLRLITSDRGSTFYMCLRSLTDSSFPKYPQLPVRRCSGFEKRLPK